MKFFIATVLLLLPSIASAHLGGRALIDNNYRVELGSVPEEAYIAGENTVFSVAMENTDGERILDIRGWLRLTMDNQIIFTSTDFQTDDGTIDLEATFPVPGQYDLAIRLIDLDTDEEATVTFPLEVAGEAVNQNDSEEEGNTRGLALVTLIIGLFVGGGLVMLAPRRKNGVKPE